MTVADDFITLTGQRRARTLTPQQTTRIEQHIFSSIIASGFWPSTDARILRRRIRYQINRMSTEGVPYVSQLLSLERNSQIDTASEYADGWEYFRAPSPFGPMNAENARLPLAPPNRSTLKPVHAAAPSSPSL